ncbi:GMC family oxidoreductase [Pedobacter immunditicola]|uniref:GMC family oxidoreductase n=1 Tax=Pedobacter immunditicola TaxID=3133440 RepID=UPI0030A629E4
MNNLNTGTIKERTFDAIVIGSGMSGGWAAKEFTEKGLKTLVLERGRDVKHIKDYPTANKFPYEFEHRGEMPLNVRLANPLMNRFYGFKEDAAHFFVKDAEHPYVQEKPFDWIRGYQVGGKSLMWAKATQRWSNFDFEGPARDGFAVDWPIRYADLAPWYSYVEKFAGIAGNRDGLKQLPDGEFLPAFPLNAVEDYFRIQLNERYEHRHVISERVAHLTKPNPIHLEQGRGQCLTRNLCHRGCPVGGYFSSNSSTLPWAERTGNLTLRPFSVAHSIIYDEQKNKATGVRVIDTNTKDVIEYYASVIFVNAGALNSNLLLLNSTSSKFPEGLGNENGLMGKFVAFHNYSARISAEFEGLKKFTTVGRNPAGGGYMPRFRNLFRQETNFLRGYAAGFSAYRSSEVDSSGTGAGLKERLLYPKVGPWKIGSHMMGETIPKETNMVTLDPDQKDNWGIPLLKISVVYDNNDEKMKQDYFDQFSEMLTATGFKNIETHNSTQNPGMDIHEMGGIRMGKDPKTSLLNKWNQLHACKNVYVTDGACMTSTSTQNPSLTFMALTARAVDHAVTQLKRGDI